MLGFIGNCQNYQTRHSKILGTDDSFLSVIFLLLFRYKVKNIAERFPGEAAQKNLGTFHVVVISTVLRFMSTKFQEQDHGLQYDFQFIQNAGRNCFHYLRHHSGSLP